MGKLARLDPALSGEPPAFRNLLRGVEVYPEMTAEDLREMGKFTELTNVEGLPAHSMDRPAAGSGFREFRGRLEDLPRGLLRKLHEVLRREPVLLVRGLLAGGCGWPLELTAAIPQSQAHLARGLQAVMWPRVNRSKRSGGSAGDDSPRDKSSDLTLIQVPEMEEQSIIHLPREGMALVLGSDDIRPGLQIAMDSASRRWAERRAKIRNAGKELESDEEAGGDKEGREEIRLLPGGSFVIASEARLNSSRQGARETPAPGTIVLFGESMPTAWESTVIEKVELLAGHAPEEAVMAGGEPWVADAGGWLSPLWFNPILAARLLASPAQWTRAALHPDAHPFGVRIADSGRIDLAGSAGDAFVIVARHELPEPFPSRAVRRRVQRVLTAEVAKQEANALEAMGFPVAEFI